jgi:hypothetical protein
VAGTRGFFLIPAALRRCFRWGILEPTPVRMSMHAGTPRQKVSLAQHRPMGLVLDPPGAPRVVAGTRGRSNSSRPPSADAFAGGISVGRKILSNARYIGVLVRSANCELRPRSKTLRWSKQGAKPCGQSAILLCSCSSGPHQSLAGHNSWSRSPPLAAPYGHKPPALPWRDGRSIPTLGRCASLTRHSSRSS